MSIEKVKSFPKNWNKDDLERAKIRETLAEFTEKNTASDIHLAQEGVKNEQLQTYLDFLAEKITVSKNEQLTQLLLQYKELIQEEITLNTEHNLKTSLAIKNIFSDTIPASKDDPYLPILNKRETVQTEDFKNLEAKLTKHANKLSKIKEKVVLLDPEILKEFSTFIKNQQEKHNLIEQKN